MQHWLVQRKRTQNNLYHLCGVQQPDWSAEPDTGRPGQEHQDREGGRTAGHSTIYNYEYITAVLRIHDILVWIRIRIWIRGSMPLTNGSRSCYFRHLPSRRQQKTNFLTIFFCLLLFVGTFISFSKIKSH
jgi:hypothetical protein